MISPITNIGIAAAMVFLTAIGQILLKSGANTKRHIILNPHVIAGYLFFVGVLFLSAVLMRSLEFKYFSMIVGLNYLVTTLLAVSFLGERVSAIRILGCVMIAAGSALFPL